MGLAVLWFTNATNIAEMFYQGMLVIPARTSILVGWQKSSVLVYAVQLLSVHDLALISNLPTVYLL